MRALHEPEGRIPVDYSKHDWYRPTCVFVPRTPENPSPPVCGKPAIAIYISADHVKEIRPLCIDCRTKALHGDGPVFDLIPVGPGLPTALCVECIELGRDCGSHGLPKREE